MIIRNLKLTVAAVSIASALGGAYSIGHLQAIGQASAAIPTPVPVAAPASPLATQALPDMGTIVACGRLQDVVAKASGLVKKR